MRVLVFIEKVMTFKLVKPLWVPMALLISGIGAGHPALAGNVGCIKGAVFKLSNPDHGIKALNGWISQPLCQIKHQVNVWVMLLELRHPGEDVKLGKSGQTTDSQNPLYSLSKDTISLCMSLSASRIFTDRSNKAPPESVNIRPRVERINSLIPITFSSMSIFRIIEEGLTPCLRAAEENEPLLAISTNSDKFSVYLYISIYSDPLGKK